MISNLIIKIKVAENFNVRDRKELISTLNGLGFFGNDAGYGGPSSIVADYAMGECKKPAFDVLRKHIPSNGPCNIVLSYVEEDSEDMEHLFKLFNLRGS